jgi:hypothetical protein
MKLQREGVAYVLSQFEADAVPADHPLEKRLVAIFGDHTFFLDGGGLKIIEPNDSADGSAETGRVVELASWVDEERTKLLPHEREATDIVVTLSKAA